LHSIDAELTQMCEQKSEAWIRLDFWPKEEINEHSFRLRNARAKHQQLATNEN
jgi:hypothetical protein